MEMEAHGEGIFPASKKVQTKKGEVVVREMMIEDFPVIAVELGELFQGMKVDDLKGADEKAVGTKLLTDPKMQGLLKRILAQLTDKEKSFYDHFSFTDTLKVIVAFLSVNDMKELRNSFFELVSLLKGTAE